MDEYSKQNWIRWYELQTPEYRKYFCVKHFAYKGAVTCKECKKEEEEDE